MRRRALGLVAALTAAGCAVAGSPNGPSTPVGTAVPLDRPPVPGMPLGTRPTTGTPPWLPALPLPATETADPAPYQAPTFDTLQARAAAGAWGGYYYAPPSPPPTPTPAPTAPPLPLEAWSWSYDVDFHATFPDGTAFPVGGSTRVVVTGLPAGARLGVLEPHASITAEGVVRAIAPGPVHAYFEHQGSRWYWLLAALPVAGEPPTIQVPWLGDGDWATWLGSEADLATWWADGTYGFDPPIPVPEVDFAQEVLLAVSVSQVWGQHDAVLTDLGEVVTLVAPDEHSRVVAGSSTSARLFRLPRAALGRPIVVHRLGHASPVRMETPAGPSPYVPPPVVTPDPDHTTPPGGYGPPPCMPPGPCLPSNPPSPAPGGCPPDPAAAAAGPVPPHLVYGHPEIDANGYAPVLPVGGQLTFRLPNLPTARWRLADPAMGTIGADGTLVARKPGAITIVAEAGDFQGRALVAAIATPEPARAFRFDLGDGDRPSDATPRGTRIFRDADAWTRFWREGLQRSPLEPPAVDFARYDVVAWVEDRYAFAEHRPVLTHVSDGGRVAHVVAPGVLTGSTGYAGARVRLFVTGKLAPDATVRVHTLCDP